MKKKREEPLYSTDRRLFPLLFSDYLNSINAKFRLALTSLHAIAIEKAVKLGLQTVIFNFKTNLTFCHLHFSDSISLLLFILILFFLFFFFSPLPFLSLFLVLRKEVSRCQRFFPFFSLSHNQCKHTKAAAAIRPQRRERDKKAPAFFCSFRKISCSSNHGSAERTPAAPMTMTFFNVCVLFGGLFQNENDNSSWLAG